MAGDTTYIVEVTFQFAVLAPEGDQQAIEDAKARVLDAFPSLESGDNIIVTIEGEV